MCLREIPVVLFLLFRNQHLLPVFLRILLLILPLSYCFHAVQLYIRDLIGSVTRPVKELKGFEKIFLKAGESKQVSFKLTADMLKFYNYNLDFVCEPGDFEVMIGGDSRDVNKALFSLQ